MGSQGLRPTQFWPDAKRKEATLLTCSEHFIATFSAQFSAAIPFTLQSAWVTTSCYRNQNSGLLGPRAWVGWHRSTQEKARGTSLQWQECIFTGTRAMQGLTAPPSGHTSAPHHIQTISEKRTREDLSLHNKSRPADLREIGKLWSKGGTCLDRNFRKVAPPFAGWVLKDENEDWKVSEEAFAIMAGSGGGPQLDSCSRKTGYKVKTKARAERERSRRELGKLPGAPETACGLDRDKQGDGAN